MSKARPVGVERNNGAAVDERQVGGRADDANSFRAADHRAGVDEEVSVQSCPDAKRRVPFDASIVDHDIVVDDIDAARAPVHNDRAIIDDRIAARCADRIADTTAGMIDRTGIDQRGVKIQINCRITGCAGRAHEPPVFNEDEAGAIDGCLQEAQIDDDRAAGLDEAAEAVADTLTGVKRSGDDAGTLGMSGGCVGRDAGSQRNKEKQRQAAASPRTGCFPTNVGPKCPFL